MSIALWTILIIVITAGGAWISERQRSRFISYCIGILAACLAIALGIVLL